MTSDNHPPPIENQPSGEETVRSDPRQTRQLETSSQTRANPRATQDLPRVERGAHVQPIPGRDPVRPPTQTALRYPARPRPERRRSARDSSLYLPWWSIALMLIGVVIVSLGLVGLVMLLGNSAGLLTEPTPIIRIITAEPTRLAGNLPPTAEAPATQIIADGNAGTSLVLAGPTLAAVEFTPTPVPITLGSTVIVEGVDAQTLNVRDVASITASTIIFRALEGERFTIIEGPVQGDGFTWWRIRDANDATRQGWAVSNYLRVITP